MNLKAFFASGNCAVGWVFLYIISENAGLQNCCCGEDFGSNSSEGEGQCQAGGTLPCSPCHFVLMNRMLWNPLGFKQFSFQTRVGGQASSSSRQVLISIWDVCNSVAIGHTTEKHRSNLNLRCYLSKHKVLLLAAGNRGFAELLMASYCCGLCLSATVLPVLWCLQSELGTSFFS